MPSLLGLQNWKVPPTWWVVKKMLL